MHCFLSVSEITFSKVTKTLEYQNAFKNKIYKNTHYIHVLEINGTILKKKTFLQK